MASSKTDLLIAISDLKDFADSATAEITRKVHGRDDAIHCAADQAQLAVLAHQMIARATEVLDAFATAGSASGRVKHGRVDMMSALTDAFDDVRHDAWQRTRESASEPYLAAAE